MPRWCACLLLVVATAPAFGADPPTPAAARQRWLRGNFAEARALYEELAKDPRVPEPVRNKLRDVGRPELEAFRRAAEAGVKIAMGTDCPISPHGTNLRELVSMSENGYTPAQALVAATSSAAALLGVDDQLGTIEAGKRADMVVVDGDPLDLEKLPERIVFVYKDGVLVSQSG